MVTIVYDAQTKQTSQQEISIPETPLAEAKQRAINILKSNAAPVIYRKAPEYKQNNAALGIYSEAQAGDIKKWIKAVRQTTDELETAINATGSISELNAVAITEQAINERAEVVAATL